MRHPDGPRPNGQRAAAEDDDDGEDDEDEHAGHEALHGQVERVTAAL